MLDIGAPPVSSKKRSTRLTIFLHEINSPRDAVVSFHDVPNWSLQGETFYDSVSGKPLFVAPKGRTWEDFEKERTSSVQSSGKFLFSFILMSFAMLCPSLGFDARSRLSTAGHPSATRSLVQMITYPFET